MQELCARCTFKIAVTARGIAYTNDTGRKTEVAHENPFGLPYGGVGSFIMRYAHRWSVNIERLWQDRDNRSMKDYRSAKDDRSARANATRQLRKEVANVCSILSSHTTNLGSLPTVMIGSRAKPSTWCTFRLHTPHKTLRERYGEARYWLGIAYWRPGMRS